MTERIEPLIPSPAEAEQAAYWARLYGRWEPMPLARVRTLMDGFPRPWWVVGGWSIDAFVGRRREHSDVDMSIFSSDVPALREHLRDRYHVWNLAGGDMRPLTDAHPEIIAPVSQVWIREHGDGPWLVDIPLTADEDGMWTNKFLRTHRLPLDDATWVADDGIRYMRPEITVFFKARTRRTKDERDFALVLPALDGPRRAWLRSAITEAYGDDHPWLSRI